MMITDGRSAFDICLIVVSGFKHQLTLFQPRFNVEGRSCASWDRRMRARTFQREMEFWWSEMIKQKQQQSKPELQLSGDVTLASLMQCFCFEFCTRFENGVLCAFGETKHGSECLIPVRGAGEATPRYKPSWRNTSEQREVDPVGAWAL